MKILALDSSTAMACVALCADEQTLFSENISVGHSHSEVLLPMIVRAFNDNGLKAHDVDLFAVSVGPGSFTGIRIGVATVKGLCSGSGKPCVPVSALAALAENLVGVRGVICSVMDARRDQMYTALFDGDGSCVKRLTKDELLPISALDERLKTLGKTVYLVGDGYEKCKNKLTCAHLAETPEEKRFANGYSVAAVAKKRYQQQPDGDYAEDCLLPVYLRATQAERERIEKMKREQHHE